MCVDFLNIWTKTGGIVGRVNPHILFGTSSFFLQIHMCIYFIHLLTSFLYVAFTQRRILSLIIIIVN